MHVGWRAFFACVKVLSESAARTIIAGVVGMPRVACVWCLLCVYGSVRPAAQGQNEQLAPWYFAQSAPARFRTWFGGLFWVGGARHGALRRPRAPRDTRAPSNRAMLLFALAVSGLQLPARHAPPRMMTDGPPARRTEAVERTEAEGGSLSDGPIFDLSFGKN